MVFWQNTIKIKISVFLLSNLEEVIRKKLIKSDFDVSGLFAKFA